MKKEKNFIVYSLLIIMFLGFTALFAWLVLLFVPNKLAIYLLGLSGLVLMTAGPFWAMGLERMIRDFLSSKHKKMI